MIEPGETVTVEPSWINNIGFSLDAVGGTASNFTGPAGATYTITDSVANYGSAAQGATVHCASMLNCYSFSVSNPSTRPAQHWDVTFTETLTTTPDSWTTPHTWTLHIGNSFLDVPTTNIFYRFVETLFHNNITAGCGSGNYCPGNSITRAQMAVFLLEAEHGPTYQPPPATGTVFNDVPIGSFAASFIEQLYAEGVTAGCGNGNYCPGNPVTRAQMAVFLLKTRNGAAWNPPPATGTMFNDVPLGSFAAAFIEELAREGITAGCGNGNYCPTNPNTRGQMAPFITVTFGLTQ